MPFCFLLPGLSSTEELAQAPNLASDDTNSNEENPSALAEERSRFPVFNKLASVFRKNPTVATILENKPLAATLSRNPTLAKSLSENPQRRASSWQDPKVRSIVSRNADGFDKKAIDRVGKLGNAYACGNQMLDPNVMEYIHKFVTVQRLMLYFSGFQCYLNCSDLTTSDSLAVVASNRASLISGTTVPEPP
ncbi:hypothetical protein PHYSODRAFT_296701 [Phytophthora sojae]|uniref:RxLR effector protein n=1 Tax=Phytophthora sojae (strain P6497) TaxID=1094619 RepID=G4Z1A0_PHYSP|nr:hypothetical protein PHYSODRAFT_296701 [Phytophthora sojae]EGZ24719.1 hypothetical protein PHYSODRAFT_296701 [Phytophthora sojae]|eukprot:XP_009520007.1 hypothetical protein PHYSODRAFT_296701 [Phytophthora sojae]